LVRKISFTGSTATGASVLRSAAQHITPALVELGGKNPFVVFEDADIDSAVAGALEGGYFNQGEACSAASRLIVHRKLHDRFVEQLACAVKQLKVGEGTDPTVHVGPVVTRTHQRKVLEYIEIGVSEGAQKVAEAKLPTDPRLQNGFFVPPTLFVGVTETMRIAREEIFGPVCCVLRFETFEDAVRIANGTEYGLVAAVYTQDAQKAQRAARRIDAGIVFINNYNRALMGTPFGGSKASGFGREHSADTVREFGRPKAIRSPNGEGEIPRWDVVKKLLNEHPPHSEP
jgi:acyl-CoA reductase-like NAD-dependent aldehyde dehydrogenase